MDTSQVQPEAAQTNPMQNLPGQALAGLLKLLQQPTRQPLSTGNHIRSGVTKNKMQKKSKTRRRMIKESKKRNRQHAHR